ncbi:hypothetical protein P872_09540 [Rhodonellum psychrophilum GCM71 = DSM 17998]|uniref:Uncharacterized protein n=2 Tax=Rhodonellum TaxID=336827 RepID=U5BU12_9BACT|nr:hypothetical protein P872_09540 [Rhodonellum psychrophilum GCM71 = DSM 17998]SDZ40385.1 hypothetical protein SAMN05444412_11326 [Rhodonellum ikkaensis]
MLLFKLGVFHRKSCLDGFDHRIHIEVIAVPKGNALTYQSIFHQQTKHPNGCVFANKIP